MRAVIIKDSVCINCVDVESLFHPDNLLMVYSDTADIGDLWDGATFTKPEPEIIAPAAPTKEELLAQLNALSAQIQALE